MGSQLWQCGPLGPKLPRDAGRTGRRRDSAGVESFWAGLLALGGVVAVQLAERYPKLVDRLILVDTASDIEAALAHQVAALAGA